MKKVFLLAAFAVFGLTTVVAQEDNTMDKVIDQAKNGGFYVGANIGISLLNSSITDPYNNNDVDDFGSFNFGFDAAYLFEVMDNLEVGLLVGYTHYVAKGEYSNGDFNDNGDLIYADFKDASFVPISSTTRYYFADRKFFGGLDLGYAINVGGDDDVEGGLYLRPKFGFNLGMITLIASYQRVGSGVDYSDNNGVNYYSLSEFSSFNAGAEFSF